MQLAPNLSLSLPLVAARKQHQHKFIREVWRTNVGALWEGGCSLLPSSDEERGSESLRGWHEPFGGGRPPFAEERGSSSLENLRWQRMDRKGRTVAGVSLLVRRRRRRFASLRENCQLRATSATRADCRAVTLLVSEFNYLTFLSTRNVDL